MRSGRPYIRIANAGLKYAGIQARGTTMLKKRAGRRWRGTGDGHWVGEMRQMVMAEVRTVRRTIAGRCAVKGESRGIVMFVIQVFTRLRCLLCCRAGGLDVVDASVSGKVRRQDVRSTYALLLAF